MKKAKTYLASGRKKEDTRLPQNFEEKENLDLLAQAIRVYQAREHPGNAKVKTRGEVALTTKKWFRQKGTGRARHGAQSAPIFVGGGVAHGPTGLKRKLSLPKKMRTKALNIALSLKTSAGEVVVVDGVSSFKKTKEAQKLLDKIGPEAKRFTFVLAEENQEAARFIRNIPNVEIVFFKNLNAYNVYFGGLLLIDKAVLEKKKTVKKSKKVVVKK